MQDVNERWLNDQNIVRNPEAKELFYKSKSLDREVVLEEILSLHIDDIKLLSAEVDAHLHELFNGDVPYAELMASLPPIAAKGLRFKTFINRLFKNAIKAELKWRKQQETEANAEKNLERLRLKAEVEAVREEKRKRRAEQHARHQKKQGRFEYAKRRIFYELLADRIGRPAIDELMDKAAELAAAQMQSEELAA